MLIKKYTFIIILIFIYSCRENPTKNQELIKPEKNYWKNVISEVEGYLPKKINSKDYIIIYRVGSIEFSSMYSVLCIPQKHLQDSLINCHYFSLNFSGDSEESIDENQPRIIGHQLTLSNAYSNNRIVINELRNLKYSEVNDYINSKPKSHSGEWHCGNLFFIRNKSNNLYVLDKDSRNPEKEFIMSLYQQISPSEYFQSFSLVNDCSEQEELYFQLISKRNIDTFDFKINYEIEGNYW